MKVETIKMEQDGSAWSAIVRVQGIVYVATYVANKLQVRLGPYKHAPRRPGWALESVQRWATAQIASLPADWLALHREMYAA